MSRVLVVDSDRASRRRAAAGLRDGGFDVETCPNLDRVRSLLRRRPLLGIVVDPGPVDPGAVVQDLRMRTQLPIIVISERAAEVEKVEMLDAGADDYVTKPFGAVELAARLRAVLRRTIEVGEDAPVVTHDFTIQLSDRRFVLNDGSEVSLSPTEWKLVEVLVLHANHLVGHADILRAVWGPEAVEKTGYLRVNISNIRRKVEPDPGRPRYFVTAPGLGLRFVPGTTAGDLAV